MKTQILCKNGCIVQVRIDGNIQTSSDVEILNEISKVMILPLGDNIDIQKDSESITASLTKIREDLKSIGTREHWKRHYYYNIHRNEIIQCIKATSRARVTRETGISDTTLKLLVIDKI